MHFAAKYTLASVACTTSVELLARLILILAPRSVLLADGRVQQFLFAYQLFHMLASPLLACGANNVYGLLLENDACAANGGWLRAQKNHIRGAVYPPVHFSSMIAESDARCYIGQYSQDGSLLVAAFQDAHIRVYDVLQCAHHQA